MQLQIITTREEMQNLFNDAVDNAFKNRTPEPTIAPTIVDGEELSKKLGITIQTLIRWREKGKFPFLKVGSLFRYDLNAVLKELEVDHKKKGASK